MRDLALDAFYRLIKMHPRGPYELMRANNLRPRAEVEAQQRAMLDELLRTAVEKIPYYRSLGIAPRIEEFPVQRKELLDQHFNELIIAGAQSRSDKVASGSGTTRVATRMLIDKSSYSWHIAVRWRKDNLLGFPPGSPTVLFVQERPRTAWRDFKNRMGEYVVNRYRMNTTATSEAAVRATHQRLAKIKPVIVDAMTSILESFARLSLKLGLKAPSSVRYVRPSGENISAEQRALFESYFNAPVRASYGAREFGGCAQECAQGEYHLFPEICYYEVLCEDGQVRPYGSGRILVTTLHNQVMPLIRYDPGDIVTLSAEYCPCGSPLPLLKEISGRTSEILYLPNGNAISSQAVYNVMDYLNAERWRVTQDRSDHLEVLVIPTASWGAQDVEALKAGVASIGQGQWSYDLHFVSELPKVGNSGKSPRVVNATETRY
jgi:phenylacetate-CoA ligase